MKNATDLIINDPSLQKSLKIFLPRQKGRESSEAESEETGLDQYFNIGQAGEGLPFLYLAYKYVEPEGAIAFVIPRNILSGISWFLARALLATKFHLKYVIISSDSKKAIISLKELVSVKP
ncbi:MAG: hypothetical protein ABIM42_05900 [candidate division WOR-3 bacterium]